MSSASRRLERACELSAALASVGFALAAFWELGDSFGAGHFASAAAVCTAAENMWQWGVAGPVTHALAHAPGPSEYYCHHPWGIFWVSALFMKLFGHHAWACRLPAALQSALTVPGLYLAGRALWGPVAGACAALSFAAVPIALSFSDFNSLEVPVIFGLVLAIWGYARFRASGRRRDAALSLVGLGYALCGDWAAAVFAAAMLALCCLMAFLLGPSAAPVNRRRLLGFTTLGVLLGALVLGAHLYVFAQLGQVSELLAQGSLRSRGAELPLSGVLATRKFWLEVSFTSLAIVIGKFALPVLVLRAALRRSDLEALPLAVLLMASFQYLVFKQGADIHVFWPHYFALYFALACAALVRTGLDLCERWGARSAFFSGIGPGYLGLTTGLLICSAIAPDGVRALAYAHRSGGRFNENGHLIKPDKDKVAALEWLTARWAPRAAVALHPGMRQSLWVDWSLQRPVSTVTRLPSGVDHESERYYVADLRFMSAVEQDYLAKQFSLTVLGPFVAIDRRAPAGPLRAFDIERIEPTRLEAYLISSSHALRRVTADAFLAWEMRDRFGLTPNEPPREPPRSFEQVRIAHNIAVSRADEPARARWLSALLAGVDGSAAQTFAGGAALLGSRVERGTSLLSSVYLRASGPDRDEPQLFLRSTITEGPRPSLVAKDEVLAEVGMPFVIPPSAWKPGYVYSAITEVIRRIGKERWRGTFRATRGAHSFAASPEFELLRLD